MPSQISGRTIPDPDSSLMQIGPIADALHEEAFGKFAQFLKRRIWWITGGVVLGLAVATALNVLEPKMYTSFAQIEIATDQSSQFRLEPVPGLDAIGAGDSERLDTEIQILKSKTLALETIQLLHLERNPSFLPLRNGNPWDISKPGESNALIGRFKQNIEVERLGHTSLIGIRATTRQPALFNLIVNTLIDSYIEHSFRDNYETCLLYTSRCV